MKKTKVGEMNARELSHALKKAFTKTAKVFVRTENVWSPRIPASWNKRKICYVSVTGNFREAGSYPYVVFAPPDDMTVEMVARMLETHLPGRKVCEK